jgi:Cu(I)/Ag(I) efflux system membrane fusion protein
VMKAEETSGVVIIDDTRRQLIGVRTGKVVRGPMQKTIRGLGQVTYDESQLTDVNIKVRGFVTKLLVNESGQRVERGQTLLTLYSPDLYAAEQDFLIAASRTVTMELGDAGTPYADAMTRAARQRLHLLGEEDSEIDELRGRGKPHESIAVKSPASGFIIEKNIVEGATVDSSMRLYRIAGLRRVWVEAEIYEADLAEVHIGQSAVVTLDYLPGRIFDARVLYVVPYLDPKTRTGRARIEIANKDLEVRPGMYATVNLEAAAMTKLMVAEGAVVYTGARRIVFVDLGGGRFRPQEIKAGAEAGGMVEVLSGLAENELVATSGVFLIAAEARIRTALPFWTAETATSDAGASSPL